MQQVIYVDVLFSLNTAVAFFLLMSVRRLCGEQTKKWRLLLGSAMGGVYSLIIFLPALNTAFTVFTRAVFLLLLTFEVFGFGSAKRFFRLWAVTAGVTFLFAGAVLGVWFALKPSALVIRNGAAYFNIGFLPLVLGAAAFYCAVRLFGLILARRTHEKVKCSAAVENKGVLFCFEAFFDTGNTLVDPFTGAFVSVASRSLALRIRPDCAQALLEPTAGELPEGVRLIPAGTANGDGLMLAFNVERLSVVMPEGSYIVKNAVIAAASSEKFTDSCEMLLNSDIALLAKKGGKHSDKANKKGSECARDEKKAEKGAASLHKRAGDLACTTQPKAGAGGNETH